ncbi:hypothetical protein CC79DRAFT_147246 [Sarocladium strictum]
MDEQALHHIVHVVHRHDALLQIPTSRPRCVMMLSIQYDASRPHPRRASHHRLHRAPRPRNAVQANARPQQAVTLPIPTKYLSHPKSMKKILVQGCRPITASLRHLHDRHSCARLQPFLRACPPQTTILVSLNRATEERRFSCFRRSLMARTRPRGWAVMQANPSDADFPSCSRLGLRWKDK